MTAVNTRSNKRMALITGASTTGKSMSLRNIRDQNRWAFLNCEAGKDLPFRSKFKEAVVTDPYQVTETIKALKGNPDIDGIIVDTLTFLFEMFESQQIYRSDDGRQAWMDFQQYFKEMMQVHVASSDKSFLFLAHTQQTYDEKTLSYQVKVPVKGALNNNGIESYFSTVVSTKRISLDELSKYDNTLLNITEDDEILGFKHVFQTRLTKDTIQERIRSPNDMFSVKETFIDNDAQKLLDRLNEYYSS